MEDVKEKEKSFSSNDAFLLKPLIRIKLCKQEHYNPNVCDREIIFYDINKLCVTFGYIIQ